MGLGPMALTPAAMWRSIAKDGASVSSAERSCQGLGDALREAEQDKTCSPWVIAAIRLLSFTGARRNEILTLRWETSARNMNASMLPDSKTGRKAVHLNAPALALLQTIPRLEGNPYVICGEKARAASCEPRKALAAHSSRNQAR